MRYVNLLLLALLIVSEVAPSGFGDYTTASYEALLRHKRQKMWNEQANCFLVRCPYRFLKSLAQGANVWIVMVTLVLSFFGKLVYVQLEPEMDITLPGGVSQHINRATQPPKIDIHNSDLVMIDKWMPGYVDQYSSYYTLDIIFIHIVIVLAVFMFYNKYRHHHHHHHRFGGNGVTYIKSRDEVGGGHRALVQRGKRSNKHNRRGLWMVPAIIANYFTKGRGGKKSKSNMVSRV